MNLIVKRYMYLQLLKFHILIDDWMPFYILVHEISIISRRWEDDNEMLFALGSCLQLNRFITPAALEPGPASLADWRSSY